MVADVSGLKQNFMRRQRSIVSRTTEDIRGQLQQNAPRETGQLQRSIKGSWSMTGPTTFKMVFETDDLVQAHTTNTGARPHLIRPRRNGGVLRFPVRGGGIVFARVVHHPGNRGTRWWDRQLTPPKIRAARRRAMATVT